MIYQYNLVNLFRVSLSVLLQETTESDILSSKTCRKLKNTEVITGDIHRKKLEIYYRGIFWIYHGILIYSSRRLLKYTMRTLL